MNVTQRQFGFVSLVQSVLKGPLVNSDKGSVYLVLCCSELRQYYISVSQLFSFD